MSPGLNWGIITPADILLSRRNQVIMESESNRRKSVGVGRIIFVVMSSIDEPLLAGLKQGLEQAFNRSVEVRVKIGSLDYAYDLGRGQYISPRILSRLRRAKKDPSDKIIGLVDVDLYSPDFDFVFGEADVGAGVGVVSLARLRPEYYAKKPDPSVLEERAIKEVIHELGHLYGLGHCPNPKCVMRFSISLGEVDRKTRMFCDKCRPRLSHN